MSRTIIALMLLAVSGIAAAEDRGFQFGVGLGRASIDDSIFGVEVDSDSFSWKAFAGYQFNRHFSVELAYLDGADISETISGHAATLDTEALQASIIGSWPLGDVFSVYGRVGISKWDANASVTGPVINASAEDDGTDPSYGVGFGALLDGALFRLEYETGKFEETDSDFLSLSIVWMFY